MARFVDRDEIDSRYFEKPYYLLPDGDEADEGYVRSVRKPLDDHCLDLSSSVLVGLSRIK